MGETSRWALKLAYRGTAFHGFAHQPGQRTVAGELRGALARLARLDEEPMITCAGRTDAGVHATAQVVHVDLPSPLPSTRAEEPGPEGLRRSLNRQLGPDISIIEAAVVSDHFDARHSATWRRYRYLVHESPVPDPLLAELSWQVPGPLDERAMAQAVGSLIGSHDFRAFCRRAPGTGPDEPIVRQVTHARVEALGPSPAADPVAGRLLRIEIQASSFCHQMVRSIVGQLVEVGRGRSNAAELVALLRSATREGAAQPAPAQGLCLIGVGYDAASGLPEGWATA